MSRTALAEASQQLALNVAVVPLGVDLGDLDKTPITPIDFVYRNSADGVRLAEDATLVRSGGARHRRLGGVG